MSYRCIHLLRMLMMLVREWLFYYRQLVWIPAFAGMATVGQIS